MTVNAQAPSEVIEVDQGDDETFNIDRNASDGSDKDISGYTYSLTVKENLSDDDADAVIDKDVSTHVNASDGITQIQITSSDTESLGGNYYYDIQEETDGGSINTLLRGQMLFETEVSDP